MLKKYRILFKKSLKLKKDLKLYIEAIKKTKQEYLELKQLERELTKQVRTITLKRDELVNEFLEIQKYKKQ